MNVLNRGLPKRIIRRLGRHPMAVVNTLSLSIRIGKDAMSLRNGQIDMPEFRKRAGAHVGMTGGAIAGGLAGAAAGTTLMPGIGTMLGGFAGGLLGEMAGGKVGRQAVERAEELLFAQAAATSTEAEPEAPRTSGGERPSAPPPKRHL